ncbi:MAG: ATP-dependent helicase [candidate division KSB1 bacterium]|nr:ATP-dependent helicase [candidate division KSB1 bacterium]
MRTMSEEAILDRLNPEQREAVTFGEGPLMVVAGAGTGKTRVITHRIAYLIATKKARPEEILALTFTDKAAAEMEERVDVLVPYGFANVWIGTFHSFGDHLLRQYAFELGLTPDFQVLAEAEQNIFFRQHLFAYPLDFYRPLGNPTRFISALLTLFSRAKDEDVSPEEYLAFAQRLAKEAEEHPEDKELQERAARQMELARTYACHQRLLAEAGMVDFGDQVALALKLLREHPSVLQDLRQRYRYILVDEFQDTNYAQFVLVSLLAGANGNITVVADDDQSIYKFRGAAISNVINFLKSYPQARLVVLTENYRSTQQILDAAYRLIRHNDPERLEVQRSISKQLRAQRTDGAPVMHRHFDTLSSEADAVASIIEQKMKAGGYCYRDFAILVRANNHADPFLRSLNMRGIPFQFSGSRGLYSREEVRLLVNFLRTLSNPDDSVSLFHLAQSEVYQFPPLDLARCTAYAKLRNISLFQVFEALPQLPDLIVSAEAQATAARIVENTRKFLEVARTNNAGVVLYRFLTESGLLKRLTSAQTVEAEVQILNIARFFDIVREFCAMATEDRVQEFVAHLDALIEAGDDPPTAQADTDLDAVNVLTVHKAKGLEFRVVFMVSLVEDHFPSRARGEALSLPPELVKDIVPPGDTHLQEERRLFFVGMTRAKEELYLTSGRDYGGKRPRKVSRFVLEALDTVRADESYERASALEVIHRHAPPAEAAPDLSAPIPAHQILTISHRQVDDYLTCPLKYKYIHVLRVPLLPHHTIVYGNAIHKALEEYHRRKLAGQDVSVDHLHEAFRRAWSSEGFLSREHEEQRFAAGLKALELYFAQEEQSGLVPALVEEEFSFVLDNDRVTGRWDRVDVRDGAVYVVDFKSSAVADQEKANKEARDSRQLSIYALAYLQVHGRAPDFVELRYVESGVTGRAAVSEKLLARAQADIKKAAQGIRLRKYAATPDEYNACPYCAYNQICPATSTNHPAAE